MQGEGNKKEEQLMVEEDSQVNSSLNLSSGGMT